LKLLELAEMGSFLQRLATKLARDTGNFLNFRKLELAETSY